MVFVGASLLPHGAMAFDGDPESSSPACQQRRAGNPQQLKDDTHALYVGSLEAASKLVALGIELVVFHTPHGLLLTESVAVYMASSAKGTAEWNDQWTEFKVDIPLDVDCSRDLMKHLKSHMPLVEGVQSFAGLNAPLRWGEVIPLWYLTTALQGQGIKTVIVSSPRSTAMAEYADRAIETGRHIASFLEARGERAVLLVSGDLSHVHECPDECQLPIYMPDPRSDFSYDAAVSSEFDSLCENWVLSWNQNTKDDNGHHGSDARQILAKAADLNPRAYACGIGGLHVLHGALETVTSEKLGPIKSAVTVRRAPTYYGMMAAIFSWQR